MWTPKNNNINGVRNLVPWFLIVGFFSPFVDSHTLRQNIPISLHFCLFPTEKIDSPNYIHSNTPSFHSILPVSPFDIDTGASPLAPRCFAINAVVAGSRAGSSPFGSVPFFGRQSGLLPFTIPGCRGFYRPRAAGGPCSCRGFAVERNSSSRRAQR